MEKKRQALYEVTEVSRIYDRSGKSYPSYRVGRERIGLYRDLEDAESLVLARAAEGFCIHDELVLFSIKLVPLCTVIAFKAPEEEYLYDDSGEMLDRRIGPLIGGQSPAGCRFRPGDLCEVLHGDEMVLGIVKSTPMDRDGREDPDGVDSCEVILASGYSRWNIPHWTDTLSMVKPRYRVHPSTVRRLRRLLDEQRTFPVRLAIETAARETRLLSVLELSLISPAAINRPVYPFDEFMLCFNPADLKGVVPGPGWDEVLIKVPARTIDRHLDELRVGLSRLGGNPLPGRGLRLKRDEDEPSWIYHF